MYRRFFNAITMVISCLDSIYNASKKFPETPGNFGNESSTRHLRVSKLAVEPKFNNANLFRCTANVKLIC
jgi:hypothetical protein